MKAVVFHGVGDIRIDDVARRPGWLKVALDPVTV